MFINVFQVIAKYRLSAPSMDQLQKYYLEQFGEQLPLTQYMSLYDTWEASNHKRPPTLSETMTDSEIAVVETTAGSQIRQLSKSCIQNELCHLNTHMWSYLYTAAQDLTREPEKEQQQKATASSFLSSSDFPVLGADVSMTKEQKRKVRGATQKEGGAPVFRESYHAQLREVHGANMRAIEALEEDEEDLTGRKRKRVLDQDTVNSLMEDVRRDIAAEGELVTKEKVVSHRLIMYLWWVAWHLTWVFG